MSIRWSQYCPYFSRSIEGHTSARIPRKTSFGAALEVCCNWRTAFSETCACFWAGLRRFVLCFAFQRFDLHLKWLCQAWVQRDGKCYSIHSLCQVCLRWCNTSWGLLRLRTAFHTRDCLEIEYAFRSKAPCHFEFACLEQGCSCVHMEWRDPVCNFQCCDLHSQGLWLKCPGPSIVCYPQAGLGTKLLGWTVF